MYGTFDKEGFASGDDLSYIYPDMSTAFHGTFDNFVMKKGDISKPHRDCSVHLLYLLISLIDFIRNVENLT